MIPARRLWLALCLLAGPLMLAGFFGRLWQPVVLADAALIALALLDAALVRSSRIDVRRQVPERFSVGVANPVRIHVVHRGRRNEWIALHDDAPAEWTIEGMPLVARLEARSQRDLRYAVTPKRRGAFAFGDLHVRVLGPLGLIWHERTVPSQKRVAVYPDLRFARKLLLASATLDLARMGVRQLRRDGRGSEFARLRDYAQGDSVREVDWKATARRSRPVTRVMETERSQTVLVAIDVGRAMAARDADGELSKLDHAVNAALLLAFIAIRNGDRVGVVLFADEVKGALAPAAGRSQYRRIVDLLYRAKPELTYVDYGALLRHLATHGLRRSLISVFTDLLEVDQASTLSVPLRRLARRHVPVCLSTKEVAIERMLAATPRDDEDSYRTAAAAERMLEREELKSELTRAGVQLVDVDPEALSIAAVNRYVEIKARGLI